VKTQVSGYREDIIVCCAQLTEIPRDVLYSL